MRQAVASDNVRNTTKMLVADKRVSSALRQLPSIVLTGNPSSFLVMRSSGHSYISLDEERILFEPVIPLHSGDNVLDRDKHQLDDVPDESHDSESHGASDRDLLELPSIRLGASLEEPLRVDDELQDCGNEPSQRLFLVGQERSNGAQLLEDVLFDVGFTLSGHFVGGFLGGKHEINSSYK